MSIDQDIKEAQKRLESKQERHTKLMQAESRLKVPDLAAFEALDDSGRRQLYAADPEQFAAFYRELHQRNEDALMRTNVR